MAAGDGLVSMKPTSIAHSGTSATINADGGVDFTAVTSLSLNGVFTSDYDNYLIVCRTDASAGTNVTFRLRAAGTDASGNDYTRQTLNAGGSSVSSLRATSSLGYVTYVDGTQSAGFQFHVYGPALAQPTAVRSVSASDNNSAFILDIASTHSVSTAYDGITFGGESNNITGNVHVFGYEE